jgi:phosphoglycerate kinase
MKDNVLMTSFLTLDEAIVTHQNVLVRLDLNLPMNEGVVSDATRIHRVLPTLQELIEKKAKVIILSHLGRPKGSPDPRYSLHPIAKALAQHLKVPVHFVDACVGEKAKRAISQLTPGEVLVLENLRYHKEEEENNPAFAEQLASLGDLYVNDAFSCSHRAHASVVGIPAYLPSYAGRSMETELVALNAILLTPKRPLTAIVGGSKVSTKLDLLQNLIAKVEFLIIGGGMANTFLKAQGKPIGASLVEDTMLETAQKILNAAHNHGCQIILPLDAQVTENLVPGCTSHTKALHEISEKDIIADMGAQTIQHILSYLDQSQTIVWNGPVGVFEIPPFDQGSVALAKKIAELTYQGVTTVAGGGDTLAALNQANCLDRLSYTSTAGGAFLEWLEGKELPGVQALLTQGNSAVTLHLKKAVSDSV